MVFHHKLHHDQLWDMDGELEVFIPHGFEAWNIIQMINSLINMNLY